MKGKRKREGAAAGPAGVDLQEVERLLEFMSQHGLEEFEYERGGLRIRLKRPAANSNSPAQSWAAAAEIGVANSSPAAPRQAGAGAAPREAAVEAEPSEDLYIVKSPIVGTFYAATSPGAEPFVKVGDQVAVGQVLCIIEAMKLMNEIESDVAGEVVRVYVENGQPVEYGESLFGIRPTRKK